MKICSVTAMLAAATLLGFTTADGQDALEAADTIYQREIFYYNAAGRVDPFRSLLEDATVGMRIEDLALRGVVHHADPARSVAILAHAGSERRIQARIGEQFGSLRIAGIHPDRVDIVIEELGVARRETLRLERKQNEEGGR
jgi:type II secretory pathway component PulC